MIWFKFAIFTAIGMDSELALSAILPHQLVKHFLSNFIKFPSFNRGVAEIEIFGEFFFQSFLVATGEKISKKFPIFGIFEINLFHFLARIYLAGSIKPPTRSRNLTVPTHGFLHTTVQGSLMR